MNFSHDFHDREDGLKHCKVCGGAEGSLPTQCPGYRMSDACEKAVFAGKVDYRKGRWESLLAADTGKQNV